MNLEAMGDIREMSFQNVVDQILKPNNVNVGGFPEEIFQTLTEEEKERFICNICFMMVNDPHQCENQHLFCNTCIFAWSMTYGENSQKCPMCRADQTEYKECKEVSKLMQDKMVRCPEDKCTFKAPLKVFLMHGHGKSRYSNTHVDFDKLRPQRPDGARLLVLPNLNVTGGTRRERAESIRSQLRQGRMMIHQMMLLLHLEMQLRQQAVTSFQQATDPTTRLHRLDEVMALNEQLNEVGTVLSTMLNSPINTIIAANRIIEETGMTRDSARPFDWETPLGSQRQQEGEDDDSGASVSSGESGVISTARINALSERRTLTTSRPSNTTQSSTTTGNEIQRDRSLRRSEIREGLLHSTSNRNATDNGDIPVISEGRRLSDYSQANIASASTVTTEIHPRVLIGRAQTPRRPITLQQSERDSSTSQTATVAVNSGASSNTTQRLTSAGTHRVGVTTTVNARNQTLPGVSSSSTTAREPSSSNNSSLPNSVARQQNLSDLTQSTRPTSRLATNTTTPVDRQQTPRLPGAVASLTSVGQRSFTPRPPSLQPSEANGSEEPQTGMPRGSTAYREVQQMLNSHRTDRYTPSRADTQNTGGSTLSRPSVSNTLGGLRNGDTSTSVAPETSTIEIRNNTNRLPTSNTGNNANSTISVYPERNRPSMLTADGTNLSNSVSRPRAGNGSRITSDTNSSTSNFGSLERAPPEQSNSSSSTTNRIRPGVSPRKKTNSLNRGTERRPILTEPASNRSHNTVHTNTRTNGARLQNRIQHNNNNTVSDTSSPQRNQAAHDGQSTTPRRPTIGTVPKIRNLSTGTTTTSTTRTGPNNTGRTLFRARRRSEIQEDLRKMGQNDG